jgi:uncharacterized iron-regulated membrane protein
VCEAALERQLKPAFISRSASALQNAGVNTSRTRLLRLPATLVVLAAMLWAGQPALADGDHDRARAAVQAGEVLPLKTVLERVARSHPGEVLEVELEPEDGRWVYEIKLLQAGGRLVKLEVDAATGEVLRSKQRPRKPH